MTPDKVRENRLRYAASRQGLRLAKSRARDPRALFYGMYALVDQPKDQGHFRSGRPPTIPAPRDGYPLDLDDVEAQLNGQRGGRSR